MIKTEKHWKIAARFARHQWGGGPMTLSSGDGVLPLIPHLAIPANGQELRHPVIFRPVIARLVLFGLTRSGFAVDRRPSHMYWTPSKERPSRVIHSLFQTQFDRSPLISQSSELFAATPALHALPSLHAVAQRCHQCFGDVCSCQSSKPIAQRLNTSECSVVASTAKQPNTNTDATGMAIDVIDGHLFSAELIATDQCLIYDVEQT